VTREDRQIVSLDEILALRWECRECHVAMSFPLNQTIRLPRTCPSCNADAIASADYRPQHGVYGEFVQALKAVIHDQQSAAAPGIVRLEFRTDPDA
jgi:hypothetical protein